MEHLLITGARGQLGKQLMRDLERKHTEIGVPPLLTQDFTVEGIDVEELDITNEEAVLDYFRGKGYTTLINCAAFTNVNKCESEEDLAYQVNAVGPGNLAKACEENGMKMIHISTDYVFSGVSDHPYREDEPMAPVSAYGRTKAAGEKAVLSSCSRSFIVRTSWLYGYFGNNFVKTMMKLGREKGAVKVVSDQVGNPTNAADLSHHLLKLVTTEEYGIYHGTGRGICSWYDFARQIMKDAGIDATVSPCTSDEFPSPAKRPAYSALDHRHFKETVGYEFRPWQDALLYFMNHLEEETKQGENDENHCDRRCRIYWKQLYPVQHEKASRG